MTIHEHLKTFHGLPVAAFGADDSEPPAGPVAWRLGIDPWDSDETFAEHFDRFVSTVDTEPLTALVIGVWGETGEIRSSAIIDQLLAVRAKFPALTGIFLGDQVLEENEISWIEQSDITPLLQGFPNLTELGVRGGDGLDLQPLRHEALRVLTIETGGLPGDVVRAVAASDFPQLRELRLWLGVPEYGADWQLGDLIPLVDGGRFPELRYLGLQNSEQQNDIVRLAVTGDIVGRLETLDLSMGVLTDEGGQVLVDAQESLARLKTLDLHHHYLSTEMQGRLRAALEPAGVRVNLGQPKEPSVYEWDSEPHYYTAISE